MQLKCRHCTEQVAEMMTAILLNPEAQLVWVNRQMVEIILDTCDVALSINEEKERGDQEG